ncbi:MAG: hypothetical protein LBG60_04450 [Bifidobacteriaceae bacterium]|jgi:hypothetical protein|nr:hypothetical protein [Bifidobacteriaceae bacterium]
MAKKANRSLPKAATPGGPGPRCRRPRLAPSEKCEVGLSSFYAPLLDFDSNDQPYLNWNSS